VTIDFRTELRCQRLAPRVQLSTRGQSRQRSGCWVCKGSPSRAACDEVAPIGAAAIEPWDEVASEIAAPT
jgi:hypothetical protein